MPDVILPLDLTGTATTNRIVGEEHTLNSTTGRCFALNYGGFYSASLIIRDKNTNQLLQPVTDYIVVAPYDSITKQTGREAACAIVIMRPVWEGTYVVDAYQAVGGEFGTNVQALKSVLENFGQETGSVHWNSIIDKPDGFDPAPHLIDFRKDVVGFEGLIDSINEIADILGSPSTGEIAAVQAAIEGKINNRAAAVNNVLNAHDLRITNLENADPGGGAGGLNGTPASNSDVDTGNDPTKFIRASNIETLKKRTARYVSIGAGLTSAALNNIQEPYVFGSFNLRSGGAGGASVPNSILPYYIETRAEVNGNFIRMQVATLGTPPYTTYARYWQGNPPAPSTWTRTSQMEYGTAALFNLANDNESVGGDINWESPASNTIPSCLTMKTAIEKWISTGRTISGGSLAQLNTTVPTVWINANLSPLGDSSVPNITAVWMVQTFTNPFATNSSIQFANGYQGSNFYTLMRTRTSGTYSNFVRIDTGRLADLEGLAPADTNATGQVNWRNSSLSNDVYITPHSLRETIWYNTRCIYPVGMISIWPGQSDGLPNNFAVCDGRTISRATYASLYVALGVRYGSTSSSNFNIPDLRGVVVRGVDLRTNTSINRDRDRYTSHGANETAQVGSYQGDAMQRITGNFTLAVYDRSPPTSTGVFTHGYGSTGFNQASGGAGYTNTVRISFDTGTVSGLRTSEYETRMRNVGMHYVIKLSELFQPKSGPVPPP